MRSGTSPWLIAVVVALAAFMEVLDTSIANVALPYMAGSLSATTEQSTWVLTSYLVSNAIVLPITGWFVSLLGRKRFFMICLAVFTLSSLLCGIAPSLGAMIVFRILQGAGGGGLQPMAQAILADTFPPQQRGLAFALFGITVVVAPILGPTAGRLDHGQLRLALDLSDQPASRHRGFAADFPSGRRSAVAEAARARRNTHRLRRRGAARPRRGRAAGDARQGTGTGLVQLAIHRHAGRPRRCGSRVAGDLGVVSTTIPSSTCAFSGISTSSAPTR